MLEAVEKAEHSITIEAYIYWAGEIGLNSRARWRPRRARRPRQDSAGCRGLGKRRQRDSRDPREGRLPRRVVQPDPLEPPAAHQQSHAPQVADHRRPDRLHRRRRHRRSLDRRRAGRQALARSADPDRGSGGAAAANGVRAELAGSHMRAGHRAAFYPAAAPAGTRAADDHELAGDRRVDGARDVLPGDFRGARVDRHRESRTSCPITSRSICSAMP